MGGGTARAESPARVGILAILSIMASEGPDDSASTSGRPSFVSAALLTYGTNLVVAFLSLINVLIVSRTLGPVGRGDVVFLTAIAWLVSNLSTFGVQEANANLGGAEPRLRRSLATNSILFALLFGILAAGSLTLLIALIPAIGGDSELSLRTLTFASLPVLVLAVYLRFLVQADYGFRVTNAAWLITPVANVTVNGLLAALGWLTVGTAVSTWIAGQVLGTALLAWYVGRRLAGFGRPDLRLAQRTVWFGVKAHTGRVMLLGNYRLDQWILGAVAGSRELGLYSVAVAWAEALWQLPTALAAVQRPDVVRASARQAAHQAATAFRAAAVITFALAIVFVAAAPNLCVTFFGESFRGSIDDLRVLVTGAFGVVALKQLGSVLTGQSKPTLASVAIGISFVATIVLDVALIPSYGGLGAAIASSVAYTVGGIAIAVIFARTLGGGLGELVPRRGDLLLFWTRLRAILRKPGGPPAGEVPIESAEELTS
jgi:O-antigen/teichoic acid export membrane protein